MGASFLAVKMQTGKQMKHPSDLSFKIAFVKKEYSMYGGLAFPHSYIQMFNIGLVVDKMFIPLPLGISP